MTGLLTILRNERILSRTERHRKAITGDRYVKELGMRKLKSNISDRAFPIGQSSAGYHMLKFDNDDISSM